MNVYSLAAILSAALVLGCATQKPLNAPLPGATQGAINRVQTGVSKAQTEQSAIAQSNTTIYSNLDRAERKDVIIKAYRKWKLTHPNNQ
jgi:hypothetical protein